MGSQSIENTMFLTLNMFSNVVNEHDRFGQKMSNKLKKAHKMVKLSTGRFKPDQEVFPQLDNLKENEMDSTQ